MHSALFCGKNSPINFVHNTLGMIHKILYALAIIFLSNFLTAYASYFHPPTVEELQSLAWTPSTTSGGHYQSWTATVTKGEFTWELSAHTKKTSLELNGLRIIRVYPLEQIALGNPPPKAAAEYQGAVVSLTATASIAFAFRADNNA